MDSFLVVEGIHDGQTDHPTQIDQVGFGWSSMPSSFSGTAERYFNRVKDTVSAVFRYNEPMTNNDVFLTSIIVRLGVVQNV